MACRLSCFLSTSLFDCRLFSNAVSPRMHQPPPKMSSIGQASTRCEEEEYKKIVGH